MPTILQRDPLEQVRVYLTRQELLYIQEAMEVGLDAMEATLEEEEGDDKYFPNEHARLERISAVLKKVKLAFSEQT